MLFSERKSNMNRKLVIGSFIVFFIVFLFQTNELNAQVKDTVVFVHTNDTHSRIEAIPSSDKRNPNRGGYALRLAHLHEIRSQYSNVLLFDSGDFLQGTPYFNFFGGKLEVQLMNVMGYHAATLGNHEFDNGVIKLAEILEGANFKVISSNYDVSKTVLKKKVLPYYIYRIGGVRVGVIGLGVNPVGLIDAKNFEGVRFLDPIATANRYADFLKKRKKCDIIVCLSHLGFDYEDDRPSDVKVAQNSKNIDVILGGHTHSMIEEKFFVKNRENKEVLIAQNGSMGTRISLIINVVGK
jgi:5'-nucleotidase